MIREKINKKALSQKQDTPNFSAKSIFTGIDLNCGEFLNLATSVLYLYVMLGVILRKIPGYFLYMIQIMNSKGCLIFHWEVKQYPPNYSSLFQIPIRLFSRLERKERIIQFDCCARTYEGRFWIMVLVIWCRKALLQLIKCFFLAAQCCKQYSLV